MYNHERKMAKTTIFEPFKTAGRKLNWSDKSAGLGFNKSIIDFVMKTQCHLVVFVESAGHDYFINHDQLKQFIENNNCDYTVSGKNLTVISWKAFTRFKFDEVGVQHT